jgi:hypothetical protein
MTASTVRVFGIVVLVLTQGCFFPVGRGGKRPELIQDKVRGNGAPSRGSQGFGPKSVQGKQPPTRLIARDGTSCVVSEKKYESTALGASV